MSTEGYKDLFTFLETTFGNAIFAKPKDKEAGPQFASILISNITQTELNKLIEKFEIIFDL